MWLITLALWVVRLSLLGAALNVPAEHLDIVRTDVRVDPTEAPILKVVFAPDGKSLCVVTESKASIFEVGSNGQLCRKWDLPTVGGVFAYSPDGMRVAVATRTGRIELRDGKAMATQCVIAQHTPAVSALSFSVGGQILATSGYDRRICLWNIEKGICDLSWNTGSQRILNLSFSPDGRFLASANGLDPAVVLWDTKSGKRRMALAGDRLGADQIAFTPGGKGLIYAGWGGVWVWDIKTGGGEHLPGSSGRFNALGVTPDGRVLAVAWGEASLILPHRGGVELWDLGSLKLIRAHSSFGPWPTCVQFSPDSKWLATGSYDGKASLWQVLRRRSRGNGKESEKSAMLKRGGE